MEWAHHGPVRQLKHLSYHLSLSPPSLFPLPLLSKVHLLEHAHGRGGVLGGVALAHVVCVAVGAVLEQSLPLLVHPGAIEQALQLTGSSEGGRVGGREG